MDNPERVTYFAASDSRGKRVPFGIKQKDRNRHLYVIGKTGMGKSTMLENMAIQDIRNGEGLAFIDPHGGTVDKILEFIPPERVQDVVYLAPFDLDRPIAFNVMEDVGFDKRHLVVSGLMATFKKIWVDAWSARMEYILSNTLLALLEYPNSTLLGVNRMYTDKVYRKRVVENIKDPLVKDFWTKEFATYTDRYTQEATPAIQNKIGQFTSNPLIRNIIGQPKSSFDIRKMMDEKKILLINLSKGLVGETNMRLLGSMLNTRLFLGAMSRAEASATSLAQLPNFYLYVDEFQNFANDTFAEILSEARKYKLNLIIAHQYIEQMEEQVRAAVFGNVGTTVAFRVGPFDAEVLETVFSPEFLKEDLVNLGFAQIYLSLMIDGVGSRPFSAVTIPPIELPERTYKEEVIAASRAKYGTDRAEIENHILEELASTVVASPNPAPSKVSSAFSGKPTRPTGAPVRAASATQSPRTPVRTPDRKEEHTRETRRVESATKKPEAASQTRTAGDLRAILKNISTKNEKESKQNQKKNPQDSLKGVLAGVIERNVSKQEKSGVQETRASGTDTSHTKVRDTRNSEVRTEKTQNTEKPKIKEKSNSVPTQSNAGAPAGINEPYEVPEEILRAMLKGSGDV